MASHTLAKSPSSDRLYDGILIENLTELVEKAEKPQPPQPARSPIVIPGEIGRDEKRNADILHELWTLGQQMAAQAFELSHPKSDPLTIALNGFPDVTGWMR